MDDDKKRLAAVSRYVHTSLRMLKMGQTGTISCNKDYPVETIKEYVMAYAFHKRKWFKVSYDKMNQVIYAERAPPPPWDHGATEREEEEL
jgi:hypothetical protein